MHSFAEAFDTIICLLTFPVQSSSAHDNHLIVRFIEFDSFAFSYSGQFLISATDLQSVALWRDLGARILYASPPVYCGLLLSLTTGIPRPSHYGRDDWHLIQSV